MDTFITTDPYLAAAALVKGIKHISSEYITPNRLAITFPAEPMKAIESMYRNGNLTLDARHYGNAIKAIFFVLKRRQTLPNALEF